MKQGYGYRIFFLLPLLLAGCANMKPIDFVLPSDVLVEKSNLIGKQGTVAGYLQCSNDFCQIYDDKSRLKLGAGSSVVVDISNLSREWRGAIIKKCQIGQGLCRLVISGVYEDKNAIHGVKIVATSAQVGCNPYGYNTKHFSAFRKLYECSSKSFLIL